MAKKVRWTIRSIIDRTNIYKYWLERNQSEAYPEKLEPLFEKSADLIPVFQTLAHELTIATSCLRLSGITRSSIELNRMKFKS